MAVSALYGAAVARSRNVPVSGTLFAGILTGLGGGMVRDVLLGLEPVAITGVQFIPAITVATVIGALVFYRIIAITVPNLLLHGLVFSLLISIGCQKAMVHGAPLASVVLCGVLTASVGGMAVDVLTRHRAAAFSQAHWVLTSLLIGSLAYWLAAVSLGDYAATLAAILVTTTLFTVSVLRDWPSPKWPGESTDMSA
jgi:uncharacterized membrane protein YeiH